VTTLDHNLKTASGKLQLGKGRKMNRTKVLTVFLAAGMALSAPLAAHAKNPHSGGGGGGGSMAGGLPGLTKRVIADEALIAALQTQVSGLGNSSFAVVGADGTLARSSSAAGPVSVVTHTAGTGLYEVDFSENVSACAYVVTLGDTGTATPPVGIVGVSGATNPDGVTIQTSDIAGAPTDEPFHLAVTCP
jgi:hypothetical protein